MRKKPFIIFRPNEKGDGHLMVLNTKSKVYKNYYFIDTEDLEYRLDVLFNREPKNRNIQLDKKSRKLLVNYIKENNAKRKQKTRDI